mmetsp:Transcript_4001/g.11364  ORF Transcript_4001/g.11364 Transcript_4001/m.11364 type:complete len:278 (-) Transcript_4001:144-977(-)
MALSAFGLALALPLAFGSSLGASSSSSSASLSPAFTSGLSSSPPKNPPPPTPECLAFFLSFFLLLARVLASRPSSLSSPSAGFALVSASVAGRPADSAAAGALTPSSARAASKSSSSSSSAAAGQRGGSAPPPTPPARPPNQPPPFSGRRHFMFGVGQQVSPEAARASAGAALEKHQAAWARLEASLESSALPIRFADIPWPEETACITGVLPGDAAAVAKPRLAAALRRWHPDKWRRILDRVPLEEQTQVTERVKSIAQRLLSEKAKLTGPGGLLR